MKTISVFGQLPTNPAFRPRGLNMEQATASEHPRTTKESWLDRWDNDRTGWHADEVNPVLSKYFSKALSLALLASSSSSQTGRVLVPLCGKTVDLPYLAKHESVSRVFGVELARKAIDEVAAAHPELSIAPEEEKKETDVSDDQGICTQEQKLKKFVGKDITMLQGNFFDLTVDACHSTGAEDTSEENAKFDVVWDRASLVAIDPQKRESYVELLHRMLKPGGVVLLVVLDRRSGSEEAMAKGPPFSVNEAEVRRLYEGHSWIEAVEKLEEVDSMENDPTGDKDKYRKEGLTSLFEVAYLIQTKKAP